jgi:hypothetical protein
VHDVATIMPKHYKDVDTRNVTVPTVKTSQAAIWCA